MIFLHRQAGQSLKNRKESRMRYGMIISSGNVRELVELACEAEAAGWDGIFVADGIGIETKGFPASPWFDPWVALSAMAVRTERVQIGTLLTPPSRRRPWKLAREVATLDHLSNGRVILSVGLGAADSDGGFYKVGEAMDLKTRAQLLDESLDIIAGLWSGKPFRYDGEHYHVDGMTMLPPPVQQPRVPIWVVGVWPKEKSMRRALQWDGIIVQRYGGSPADGRLKPDEIRTIKAYVDEHRQAATPFDILAGGATLGKSRKRAAEIVRPYIEAGATWWVEEVWGSDDKVRARVRQGPPRAD
jgi:alkanesulfonate monooxygenase SsuD/methylene tetrahydromethanopterin reductase-like flavin-dependent oxidoreductase (luciferase family)